MRYAYGVDVGGTNIKAVVTGENGVVAYRESFSTPNEGAEGVVKAVCKAIERLDNALKSGQVEETYGNSVDPKEIVETIGVAVPGIVDEAGGNAVFSINLDWHNFPMRRAIANASGRAIALGHDVRSGALAESRWGAGSNSDSCLYLALGTGVSAALILNEPNEQITDFPTEVVKEPFSTLTRENCPTKADSSSALGTTPASLIDRVCSPAGTTVAGLIAAEQAGLANAAIKAVEAACKRDAELREN